MTEGMKPVVAIYSTFLQRGYDQLIHDVALQELFRKAFRVFLVIVVDGDGQEIILDDPDDQPRLRVIRNFSANVLRPSE